MIQMKTNMDDELIPMEETADGRLHKCTGIQKQDRINEVVEMMGELKSNSEIQKFLMEKYGLTKSSTEPYLREAKQALLATIPDPQEIIAKHIKKYTKMARKLEDTDARSAMIALNNIEKLLKLNVPQTQVNQQFNTLNLEGVDFDNLMDAIKALKSSNE